MKKTISFAVVIAVAAILSSCSATMPLAVTSAPIGNKSGTSSTGILFGVWQLNKDYGLAEAVKNGGITGGVAIADIKVSNYLIFQKKTIIVYGK